jgi:hypothetical protein
MKAWKLSNGETIRQADNGYGFVITLTLDLSEYGRGIKKTESYLEPDEIIPCFKRNYNNDLHLLREIVPTHWAMSL